MKTPFLSLLFILFCFSSSLHANNTWTLTGDLNSPRAYHSATTLDANRILVAGGDMESVLLDSAEIYDLNTSLWTATNSMNQKRQQHAAIQLNDGHIMVVGGIGLSGDMDTAEVFDPETLNWSMIASMSSPRVNPLITKLQDDRILVSGGTKNGTSLKSAEIYDPASNTWAMTGVMVSDAVHTNSAVLLNDGRVFIKGHAGYINGPFIDPITPMPAESDTKPPQIYDPANNNWSAASPMNTPKRGGTSILLNDGNVLVVGGDIFVDASWGYPYFTCNLPAEIYHPDTDTWTETGTLTNSSLNPSKVALMPDGKVLAFGPAILSDPYSACGSDNGLTEIYDPATGTWSATDTAAAPHLRGGAFSSLADGKTFTIGGGNIKNIVEAYTPSGASPFSPPRSETMHVGDIDGSSVENGDDSWTATAIFSIVDENNDPVYRAVATIGSKDCVTNNVGQCSIVSTTTSDGDRFFTVRDIAKLEKSTTSELPPITYIASANTDPDGDSDGTTIVIQRGGGSTPPPPTTESAHIVDLDDTSIISGNLWTPGVTAMVYDNLGRIAVNARVRGTWGNGLSDTGYCFTDTTGTCTILYSSAINISSAPTGDFTVTDVSWSVYPYAPGDNTDPDGDSNGTYIVLNTPDVPPGPTPASIMFVTDLEGIGEKKGKRRWQAKVYITVSDDSGNPVANAEVTGDWGTSGASGSSSCTTDSSGTCRVSSDRVKNVYVSVTFSVTDITHSSLNYDASLNTDADGDSGGTTFWVSKP